MKFSALTNDAMNELLLHIYEDQQAYAIALKHIQEQSLRMFLEEKIKERLRYEKELTEIINMRAKTMDQSRTLIGKARNAWLDIKAVFHKNAKNVIIEGLLKGERLTLRHFENVLYKFDLSKEHRSIINNQRMQLKQDLIHLEGFKTPS